MNITLDEIRSKAPEGATHYRTYGESESALYFKFYNNGIYVWDCDHWRRFSCFVDKLKPL